MASDGLSEIRMQCRQQPSHPQYTNQPLLVSTAIHIYVYSIYMLCATETEDNAKSVDGKFS